MNSHATDVQFDFCGLDIILGGEFCKIHGISSFYISSEQLRFHSETSQGMSLLRYKAVSPFSWADILDRDPDDAASPRASMYAGEVRKVLALDAHPRSARKRYRLAPFCLPRLTHLGSGAAIGGQDTNPWLGEQSRALPAPSRSGVL